MKRARWNERKLMPHPLQVNVYSPEELFCIPTKRWRHETESCCNRFHNTRTRQKERGILCRRLLTSKKGLMSGRERLRCILFGNLVPLIRPVCLSYLGYNRVHQLSTSRAKWISAWLLSENCTKSRLDLYKLLFFTVLSKYTIGVML